jgi:hypothetical protein
LVDECFDTIEKMLVHLERMTPQKSPMEIIQEAKAQVKAYEQKQNTKPRWSE